MRPAGSGNSCHNGSVDSARLTEGYRYSHWKTQKKTGERPKLVTRYYRFSVSNHENLGRRLVLDPQLGVYLDNENTEILEMISEMLPEMYIS